MPSTQNTKSGRNAGTAQFYGPVNLKLEFRRNVSSTVYTSITIEPQHIKELSITLDMKQLLPSFRLRMNDSAGIFTHLLPFDHDLSKVHIKLGRSTSTSIEDITYYHFDVYRRFPTSDREYIIEGLLAVKNLLSPGKVRGFGGTAKSTIETIGAELGIDTTDVSTCLDYKKNILQPSWSNARLLIYLRKNLLGLSHEANFYCFVKCVETSAVLTFKSVRDFLLAGAKYNFLLGTTVYQDDAANITYYPVIQYKMFENYKALGVLGTRRLQTEYFDWTTSQFVRNSYDIDGNTNELDDYYSFTQYHQIDQDDPADANIGIRDTGRNNGFTSDFAGRTLNQFHQNITDLSKMWINTIGLENIYPGDLVLLEHIEQRLPQFSYQHKGYWMVERVVHLVGHGFMTKLLLTRNGSNSAIDTRLLSAARRKR